MTLDVLDLWSLILYGITSISYYLHWNTCVTNLYRRLFYHSRVITSNTNTMNNDSTQNNYNNNNNSSNNNNDNKYFNNNISKYYWKIRRNDIFCFPSFGGAIATQGVICHPRVRKDVIKLQQIISKHNQAYIPTAI